MEYLFIVIIILSVAGFIYFGIKTIVTRRRKHVLGLIISSIPLILTAVLFWVLFIPYREIHAHDKIYFGEYEFKKVEGKSAYKNLNRLKAKLILKPDFTYTLTGFDEQKYPSKGKWRSCWTDDCQFGFNYNKKNYFLAMHESDSSGKFLKLHKSPLSNTYLVFRKKE